MKKVIIIAEAGVNHNGDINLAKKLIDAAVDAGVDYVKFQTFKAENIVVKEAKKAAYQIENTQNVNENWNIGFQFRRLRYAKLYEIIEPIALINSTSLRFFTSYKSKNNKYNFFAIDKTMSFSFVPFLPTAPGSLPPCPASKTTTKSLF